VVNDLTDKDGNRVIELGELTVRVGANSLSEAGTRPARADDEGSVTIEHADGGASIIIKQDGSIVIHAAKDLELKSDQDIKLDANNVKVTVSGTMDVS
jgi:phage gp45-like